MPLLRPVPAITFTPGKRKIVGVIAALVTVGIAALGLFTAQQLFSHSDQVAGPTFRDQGTGAATRPSVSAKPSVSAAVPVASAPADDSSEASSAKSNVVTCEKPDAIGVARVVEIDTTGGPNSAYSI
jgi:hypothetical protein